MKIFLFFSGLSIFHLSAYGGVTKRFVGEFLEKNLGVKESKLEVRTKELELKEFDGSFTFILGGGLNYSDSRLAQGNQFAFDSLRTESGEVSLRRPTLWGGELQLTNSWVRTDAVFAFNGQSLLQKEFRQQLSYTQSLGKNFFGSQQRKRRKILETRVEASGLEEVARREIQLKDFYQAYMKAIFSRDLYELTKNAEKRAMKRYSLVKRRVRDGLRDKVDQTQALIELKTVQEGREADLQKMSQAKRALEQVLQRKVEPSELPSPRPWFQADLKIPQQKVRGPRIRAYEKAYALRSEELEIQKNELLPDITLSLGLETNGLSDRFSESMKNGWLGKDNNRKFIGLNVSWPLNAVTAKASREKAFTLKQMAQIRLQTEELNNQRGHLLIVDELEVLKKRLTLAKEKTLLSQKAQKRIDYLYSIGKADLERAIVSEQNVIAAEKGLLQLLSLRESLRAELLSMHGEILPYLNQLP